jgi:divalent metal cation (Fe/Co/Zn/Cd) transporter
MVNPHQAPSPAPLDAGERDRLVRRGLRLEYATIAWNVGEAVLTIWLGIAAGSIALVAFGTDSIIEVFASSVVIWHARTPDHSDGRTPLALRLIAVAFFALGAALLVGATVRLASGVVPDESPLGIAYLAATVIVMLGLAILKAATGRRLQSKPLLAEARVTYLDAGLAATVLVSLVLNSLFGWWWADPVGAMVVALVAIDEGRENWVAGDEPLVEA